MELNIAVSVSLADARGSFTNKSKCTSVFRVAQGYSIFSYLCVILLNNEERPYLVSYFYNLLLVFIMS